jgi:hypothetical protein
VLGTVRFLIACIAIKVVVCVEYNSVPDSVQRINPTEREV